VVRIAGGQPVVVARGDIDAYTGPKLAEHLNAALDESSGNVTLDLSDVAFVDSSGIAVFVAAAKRLRERGSDLVVESPPKMLTKLLEMTGVTKLVKVERSRR
jgi:anti-sigma B factor antagonist